MKKPEFKKINFKKFKFKKKYIKWIVLLVLIIAVVLYVRSNMKKAMQNIGPGYETTKLETKDLEMSLTSSGVIAPLNQYSVMPLVQGEVLEAPFKEGQQVKKGDLLYRIDTKDIKNAIESAKLGVQQAQNAYNDAQKLVDTLTMKSNVAGYVKKLNIKVGDNVAAGTPVAEIYDNTVMNLNVPFNSGDVSTSWIGKHATVYAGDSMEKLSGTVIEIAPSTEVLAGGMVVKKVKIAVKNPGGISADMTGIAAVGGVDCNSEGTFEVKEEKTLIATGTGEISQLDIKEGQYLKEGVIYARFKGDSVDSQIKNAKIGLETAKLTLKNQQNSLENYSIKAPISGQVITKNVKKGDTINASSAATSTNGGVLAIIYDLSAVKFEMKIDELDVKSISIGQKVQVTSDALEGVKMTGHIENISLNSEAKNGVTQYPVTVRMDEVGELLPGMNVEGKIVTASAKNVQTIPVIALQRGNIVYVKDQSLTKEEEEKARKDSKKSLMEQMSNPAGGGVPTGFKEVTVEVGINDGSYVEIKSGLSADDIIYLPQAQSINGMMMSGDDSEGGESQDAQSVE